MDTKIIMILRVLIMEDEPTPPSFPLLFKSKLLHFFIIRHSEVVHNRFFSSTNSKEVHLFVLLLELVLTIIFHVSYYFSLTFL